MLHLVVDNTDCAKFRLYAYVLAHGIASISAKAMLDALRDLAIDLKIKGVGEAEAREELRKAMRYVIGHNAITSMSLAAMTRAGEADIDVLMDMVRPLRARPQPQNKPAPKADPGADDVIDVEFEEVTDLDGGNDNTPAAILFAIAA